MKISRSVLPFGIVLVAMAASLVACGGSGGGSSTLPPLGLAGNSSPGAINIAFPNTQSTSTGNASASPTASGSGSSGSSTSSPSASPAPGPTFGTVSLGVGVSGSCNSGSALSFTSAGEVADIPLGDSTGSSTFTIANPLPNVATATINSSTLIITAAGLGTTTVTISDPTGYKSSCNVVVNSSASASPSASASASATATATPTPVPSSTPQVAPLVIPSGTTTVSGSCSTGVNFTALNVTVTAIITESGYSGDFTILDPNPTVVQASMNGSTLSLTSLSTGSSTLTISDSNNHSQMCAVNVTTTGVTLQGHSTQQATPWWQTPLGSLRR